MAYPREWRAHAKNPFPPLIEYWYCLYVRTHFRELGFERLEGPFATGVDFKGVVGGRRVSVEVERDYISYLCHGHQNVDVLVVGVLDPPHPDMAALLPPIIKNLDPQEVLDYTRPMRQAYKEEKKREKEKERKACTQRMERAKQRALKESIPLDRAIIEECGHVMLHCDCGGMLIPLSYLELAGELTEGQLADCIAGFRRIFRCRACGATVWVKDEGGIVGGSG